MSCCSSHRGNANDSDTCIIGSRSKHHSTRWAFFHVSISRLMVFADALGLCDEALGAKCKSRRVLRAISRPYVCGVSGIETRHNQFHKTSCPSKPVLP